MTIGIAAHGPRAGEAVLEALRAVEVVARGEIRGFATFAVITEAGDALCFTTQRGGSAGLDFGPGDRPPAEVLEARVAGVISSGPDRTEPLEKFIAVDAAAGLVTGHRSPDAPGRSGVSLNRETLELIRRGALAKSALDQVIAASEHADVGLIAVDLAGGVYARNSARVVGRPDVGEAVRHDSLTGGTVAVLHNAIQPAAALASLAAETALAAMAGWWQPDLWLTLRAGTTVELGPEESIVIDEDGVVLAVRTTDRSLLTPEGGAGACPYLGAGVFRLGKRLGVTASEGYTVVSDGRIESIVGRPEYRIGCRLSRPRSETS